jgi:hypothetical protein
MQKLSQILFQLLLLSFLPLGIVAQDFKLYYAKNVTDVTHFTDNVDELAKQLDWKEVLNNAIDGNQVEAYNLVQMLGSTRMKGLNDQRQFWRMRDHALLCFRINDGAGKTGAYSVDVDYGPDANGEPLHKTITTSKYFFANMPLQVKDIKIKVWSKRDKKAEHAITFTYSNYGWNDENLYLFQLDQKRQSTGDTYKMEYVTSYLDDKGETQAKSTILEVRETMFQSFYVPDGHTLSEVYFLTGNERDGDVKMLLNMADLHPGIDLDYRLDTPTLTTTFQLDKHEDREMVNFNWLGTGEFEKYDTLYLKLFNQRAVNIDQATIHIHRVDDNGMKVDDPDLRYLGYDAVSRQHKILTHGHAAYIEILAPGCLPTLFRYKGAAHAGSKIVSEDLCSAKLTLRAGNVAADQIAISDQYLRYLNDLHVAVARNDKDYTVCTIKEYDMAAKTAVDTLCYMDNGGNDYPKLFNNNIIDRFAELEVVFSSPKGGTNPSCQLTATELSNNQRHTSNNQKVTVVSAAEFDRFDRDYFFLSMSLVDVVPRNSACSLSLQTKNVAYTQFPKVLNVYFDSEEEKKKAETRTEESTKTEDPSKNVARADQETKMGLSFPPTFKFEFGPMKMSTGMTIDITKQVVNFFISGSINSNDDKADDPKDKYQDARKNAKGMANWNYKSIPGEKDPVTGKPGKSKGSYSFTESKLKYDDWVLQESGSIFDVAATHIGFYYGGGFKIALQAPLFHFSRTQVQEATLFAEGGVGFIWSPKSTGGAMADIIDGLSFIGLAPDVGFVLDANAKLTAGLKSFDNKMESKMSAKNMGLFTDLTFSTRLGAWLGIRTPQTCLGGFKVGFRAGAKAAISAGLAVPLDASDWGGGGRYMMLGIVELYAQLRALFFHWNASIYARVGKQWLFPDAATNPYHKDFPHWLENKSETRTIANSFRPLRVPAANEFGQALVTAVAGDANPHFIDDRHVVYNDLGKPDDYNDDQVTMIHLEDNSRQTVSVPGTSASQHMRSKRGKPEIVVYQQMAQTVSNSGVTDKNAVRRSLEAMKHTKIMASVRTGDGTWQQMDVTTDDGFVDQMPVVTIQDDGKAACVYQHGQMQRLDETVSEDSAYNHRLVGQLLLRTYDGTKWSEPIRLYDIGISRQPTQYDLFMRNDTVLVGVNMSDQSHNTISFQYASKPLDSSIVTYVDEQIQPLNFFMNRVGKNAVIAMLYERPDQTREVYVKTLAMNGQGDGRSGCDLGLGQSMPDRVKIVCDRGDDNANDFAVLWTETNNIVRDAVEGNSANRNMGTVLNASRVHLSDAPSVTYPLTVGSDRDSLFLTDFDGILDDDRIEVVYTLTHVKSGSALILRNEKYFANSFEADVTYTREALLGSKFLPVNVTIRNTGTSAINGATAIINGQNIPIADVFVKPLDESTFVVQYPIPESFDGYMSSKVEVTFENVFKNESRPALGRRRAMNLRRQVKSFDTERVTVADIDCTIIGHTIEDGGANTVLVELTDRSSRGLMPGTGVLLGFYPHPGYKETINGQAQTLVRPEEFVRMGGVRKAYAKAYISGITEPISAYLVPQIVDLSPNQYGYTYVTNIRSRSNASYVNLFPSADPTKIVRPALSKEPEGHRVRLTSREDGVLLSNLEAGDDVRIFNAQGFLVYKGTAAGSTLFIPLTEQGIFVLSAGKEIFKFIF